MNAIQIKKMLHNIKADYIGMGRKSVKQDNIIIDTIMHLYNEQIKSGIPVYSL